ncbi:MAG: triose-phosphate isomerase, partial [Gammaproteobacteria bacterium]
SSAAEDGAYTGEVSAAMLADVGCRRVIVGHSERRQRQGETDEAVAAKFEAALEAGLAPILCVGETAEQHRAGHAEEHVCAQLDAVLERVGAKRFALGALAYEPIWAIGSGEPATPAVAESMHRMLRKRIAAKSGVAAEAVCIIYGGSVKPDNAAEFFSESDIDGALVGGASLDPTDFCAIMAAARAV